MGCIILFPYFGPLTNLGRKKCSLLNPVTSPDRAGIDTLLGTMDWGCFRLELSLVEGVLGEKCSLS